MDISKAVQISKYLSLTKSQVIVTQNFSALLKEEKNSTNFWRSYLNNQDIIFLNFTKKKLLQLIFSNKLLLLKDNNFL